MPNYTLNPTFTQNAITEGRAYYIAKILTVPADGEANIHIRNPPAPPTNDMWITSTDISVTGATDIVVHDSFDSITDGTSITIQNALLDEADGGGPDEGPFLAFSNSTYSANANGTVPIGISAANKSFTETTSYFPQMVENGREIVFSIENQESAQQRAIISMLLITPH